MGKTEQIINYFLNNTDALLKISIDEIRDVVALTTIVMREAEYQITLKEKAFVLMCHMISKEKLPLEERWALYWNIIYTHFTHNEYDAYELYTEMAYETLYEAVEKCMPQSLMEDIPYNENNGPVVVITSQFLSEGHAPTRRVLDYSYTINQKWGIPVVIINDGGLNIKRIAYLPHLIQFDFIKELSDKDTINYKGATFSFYQSKVQYPDIQEIANILFSIKKMKPRLVLNVGASCLTSDLCRHFSKTATITCSTSIPRSLADNLVVCRDLRLNDQKRLERLKTNQVVIESVFNYIMPDESNMKRYERFDFGIPEDGWLICSAGNRMQEELDYDFMNMVDNILDKISNSYFLIVGGIENPEILVNGLKNKDKIVFAGQVADGCQVIRLSNVYIQPRRKGGGRAAFEALYYGVPAVVVKYGDAWDVCGKDFEVDAYADMENKIFEYYFDRDYYHAMQNVSRNHALKLEDMGMMFENLFEKLQIKGLERMADESKFKDIFDSNKNEVREITDKLEQLTRMVWIVERRVRDNEWATVFNNTITGSEWLHRVSLSPGRCALAYPGLYALYRSLDEFRPKKILEMGLGQSTRVISAYSKYFDAGHYIVEHDETWIQFFLDKYGKGEKTEIVCLNRREEIYQGRWIQTKTPIKFYEGFKEKFQGEKFDFVFIDGPQGSQEVSRVDFTELLPEALEESFVIMIDDSERHGESATINVICNILQNAGISILIGVYDGIKDTTLIVSSNLRFLLSL